MKDDSAFDNEALWPYKLLHVHVNVILLPLGLDFVVGNKEGVDLRVGNGSSKRNRPLLSPILKKVL